MNLLEKKAFDLIEDSLQAAYYETNALYYEIVNLRIPELRDKKKEEIIKLLVETDQVMKDNAMKIKGAVSEAQEWVRSMKDSLEEKAK